MKKKLLALVLALVLIPAAVVLAAQAGYAELRMKDIYAVIGGSQSITIRSHADSGGRGGYCEALYAVELTGKETRAELDALAVSLVKSDTKPVWGGGKHCIHVGSFNWDREFAMKAADYAPGSYLYVCYTFGCTGSHSHELTPYYERVSTMGIRVTKEARGLELRYALTGMTEAVKAGGELELKLDGGRTALKLLSDVAYPVERIVGVRADFDKNQAVDPFDFDEKSLSLTPVCCGEGSITVTIGNYLDDTTRKETVFVTVPCTPAAERTMLVEPTCIDGGVAAYLCLGHGINCETVFDEVLVDPKGHSLLAVEEYLLEPTATQPGIGLGECAVCGREGAEQALPPIFSDVSGRSFYSEPLDYCYEKGWVTGVTADTFRPGSDCVRA